MHASTSERELQARERLPPSSGFTFRGPLDSQDRLMARPSPAAFARSGGQTYDSSRERPGSNAALVAQMLRQRREAKQGRVETEPVQLLGQSPQKSSPDTVRQLPQCNEAPEREPWRPDLAQFIRHEPAIAPEPRQTQLEERTWLHPRDNAAADLPEVAEVDEHYWNNESPESEQPPPLYSETEAVDSAALDSHPSLGSGHDSDRVSRPMPSGYYNRTNVFDRLTADARRKQGSSKKCEQQIPVGENKLPPRPNSRTPRDRGKIEDRLLQYQREREGRLAQARAEKQSEEMRQVQDSPRISSMSEKLVREYVAATGNVTALDGSKRRAGAGGGARIQQPKQVLIIDYWVGTHGTGGGGHASEGNV